MNIRYKLDTWWAIFPATLCIHILMVSAAVKDQAHLRFVESPILTMGNLSIHLCSIGSNLLAHFCTEKQSMKSMMIHR